MPKITLTPKKKTPALKKYVETYNHLPSPETLKFKSETEIEEMAEVALMRGKPVKEWAGRANRKTGTILDDLYN